MARTFRLVGSVAEPSRVQLGEKEGEPEPGLPREAAGRPARPRPAEDSARCELGSRTRGHRQEGQGGMGGRVSPTDVLELRLLVCLPRLGCLAAAFPAPVKLDQQPRPGLGPPPGSWYPHPGRAVSSLGLWLLRCLSLGSVHPSSGAAGPPAGSAREGPLWAFLPFLLSFISTPPATIPKGTQR